MVSLCKTPYGSVAPKVGTYRSSRTPPIGRPLVDLGLFTARDPIDKTTGTCDKLAEYKCEICEEKYCCDCMYLICEICHKFITCFRCGFDLRYRLKKCMRHIGETVEKCETTDCTCKEKRLSKV